MNEWNKRIEHFYSIITEFVDRPCTQMISQEQVSGRFACGYSDGQLHWLILVKKRDDRM